MAEWTARRFWSQVGVIRGEAGFGLELDGKPVRTPSGAALALPTRAFAEAVAAEWREQGELVQPATMPATRCANSAIETVAPQRAGVEAMLAGYGSTDLLCYRAASPAALVARQASEWDPLLGWARERHGAGLATTTGILPVPQPEQALRRLARQMEGMSIFELTAFHDLVTLSGSLVLGLATFEGVETPERLWEVSRLDEIWQSEQWGHDDEAERAAAEKGRAFGRAAHHAALAASPD